VAADGLTATVAPGTPFVTTLRQLASEAPARPALTCDGVTQSRSELLRHIERLAALFARHGASQGAVITIGLPNSAEFVEAIFAAWLLGAIPQPVSHRLAPRELKAIVALANPALTVGIAPDSAPSGFNLSSEDLHRARVDEREPDEIDPGMAPIWKVVTSGGSTGRPKLIAATQPALTESVVGLGGLLHMRVDGCVLVTAPMTHNAPFVAATASLLLGNHLVLLPKFDAAETLALADAHRVTWLYLVPTMMHRIWRLPEPVRLAADLTSLEVAFHMAAPCPQWLKRAWIDWLGADRILELYGGTELQAMTVITGEEWLAHPGSVGRPVIGEIECRDEHGRRPAPGAVGELWMRRGAGQPSPYRYIGAIAKTADEGWESLGDLGYVDDDGYVFLTDRDTDMIVVGGANVYPAEIEAALDEHPAVRSSCVIGLPDDDLGSTPHAIVELAAIVTDAELLAHLRKRLAPYKLPRTIERVDHPLRDDAGKVRRTALRAERLASR
jgi:bile acid-coenzyme A ligase